MNGRRKDLRQGLGRSLDAPLPDQPGTREEENWLVTRHRYGDAEAFEELYSRHHGMVFNTCLRMTADRELAADLTQEVFLRVFRHLASFRGRSSLKTWITRIAINCCRSRLRRREKRRRLEQPAGAETVERLPDSSPGPEAASTTRADLARVERALAELPAAYREVVVLRDVGGFAYREIARIAGVRIGTVRSRIARGRHQLRQLLEEDPP